MQDKNIKYIAIEGNIGSGKSSLLRKLASILPNVKTIAEDYDTPLLTKFYKNPENYAMLLEFTLLIRRYKQIIEIITKTDDTKYILADYAIFKSLIFSKINLDSEGFKVFYEFFQLLIQKLPLPHLVIYLDMPIKILQQRIQLRGREFEMNIADGYLEKIKEGYARFFYKNIQVSYLSLGLTDFDIINNPHYFQEIVEIIQKYSIKKDIEKLELTI